MSTKVPKKSLSQRTYTRFCAVQALYQVQLENGPLQGIIAQFDKGDFAWSFPVEQTKGIDRIFLRKLVEGVHGERKVLQGFIEPSLKDSWRYDRMDPVLLVLIQCALYELLNCLETSISIIISEYLTLCRLFYGDQETAFVHGILDHLGKIVRSSSAM